MQPPALKIARPPQNAAGRWSSRWMVLLLVVGMVVIAISFDAMQTPPPDAVGWHNSYDEAAALAAQSDKMVLMDFWADWCPPCQTMDRQVFSREPVGRTIRAAFVPVRMDLSRRTGMPADYAEYFRIEAYPTMIALDSAGREIARHVGAMNEAQLLLWLAEVQRLRVRREPG